MSIINLLKKFPQYAGDIKELLSYIFLNEKTSLSQKHLYGVSLSCAYSLHHEQLLNSIRSEAKLYLEDSDATLCKTASVLMAMTNTYSTFLSSTNLSVEQDSKFLPYSISQPISPEMGLYCLAVSILNNSETSMKLYMKIVLNDYNFPEEYVTDIARLSSLLKAAKTILEIERMRSYDFIVRDANMND